MENLPRNLFDSDYYYKTNPDVLKAGADAYDHYFKHGISEGRNACLNYSELSLNQLKYLHYHAIPSDNDTQQKENSVGVTLDIENSFGNVPFYLKNNMVSHFPVLEYYAAQCRHITEFGVRHGLSTLAFLYGLPDNGKLESYDIEITPFVTWLSNKALTEWEFYKRDTTDKALKINETDLLFFDSSHSYKQLSKEIELHAEKSRRFLVFHGTEKVSNSGITKAIDEYLHKNKCKIIFRTNLCHGLLILEK